MMRFESVALESVGYCVPDEYVSSDEIERQLDPLYKRLRLPAGRLELMTGIRERRFWPPGMLPSDQSIRSGNLAIEAAGFPRSEIGCLIHGSVCRDHLEPATACRVHQLCQLPDACGAKGKGHRAKRKKGRWRRRKRSILRVARPSARCSLPFCARF